MLVLIVNPRHARTARVTVFHLVTLNIRESVDSICRDSADMPISLNKCNSSELSIADVLRQTTCSANASIHSKDVKYTATLYGDSGKIVTSSSFFFGSNGLPRNWR